jgi:hypothetical protein
MNQISCREFLNSLSEFLDEESTAELCAEIKQHMGGCRNCRVVIDSYCKTISIYKSLPDPTLPDQARERLYRVLDLTDYIRPQE